MLWAFVVMTIPAHSQMFSNPFHKSNIASQQKTNQKVINFFFYIQIEMHISVGLSSKGWIYCLQKVFGKDLNHG